MSGPPKFISEETRLKFSLYNEANACGQRISYQDASNWVFCGYQHVVLFDLRRSDLVRDWIAENIKPEYMSWANGVAVFKEDEDAVMFKLLFGE